ncbi:SH3 domain-containing protein [Kiritimatiellaeota bacterium B1221]|nr:SH3 domain-containing protein [Kiritimatiellaeota bacterium B1221]
MKILQTLFLFVCLSLSLSAEEPIEVTVLGDRVNLRNAKGTESDVVGQANYGQKLQAISIDDEWVQVRPPADLAAWVYSPLLFEDKEVRAPELNVRSGPGTQFIILGELKRGDPVSVIESLEEWRKIEPPEAVTLWISRDFVQIPESALLPEITPEPTPLPTPAPPPAPTPVPTPITIVEIQTIEKIVEVQVTPTPMPKVDAPEGLDLVPLKGQGTLSKRRGVVRAYLLAGSSPSRFSLVRQGEEKQTLCYLLGDEEMLKQVTGKTLTVSGRDFWVTGQRLPVTQVEKVELLEETP